MVSVAAPQLRIKTELIDCLRFQLSVLWHQRSWSACLLLALKQPDQQHRRQLLPPPPVPLAIQPNLTRPVPGLHRLWHGNILRRIHHHILCHSIQPFHLDDVRLQRYESAAPVADSEPHPKESGVDSLGDTLGAVGGPVCTHPVSARTRLRTCGPPVDYAYRTTNETTIFFAVLSPSRILSPTR